MSNSFNHSNRSEQFKRAVAEGLASGDFRELNILVNETVSDAISEAGKQMKNVGSTTYRNTSKIYESAREYEEQQRKRNARYKQTYQSSGILKSGYPGLTGRRFRQLRLRMSDRFPAFCIQCLAESEWVYLHHLYWQQLCLL